MLGGFSIYSSIKSLNSSQNIINQQLPLLIQDEKLSFNMSQRIALSRGYILFNDPNYKESFLAYTEESKRIQEQLLTMTDSQETKELIDKSITWRKMIENEVFTAYEQGHEEEALRILKEKATPLAREIMDGFQKVASEREKSISVLGSEVVKMVNPVYYRP